MWVQHWAKFSIKLALGFFLSERGEIYILYETQTRHVLASVSVQRLGLTSGIVDKNPTTSRRLD
jgi:hypothetical protein